MQGYINLWDNRPVNIVTGEPDADGSYLDPYYSWYNTVTRKHSDEDLDLPHDTFDVGPSQVTQAESQKSPLRRVLT
ncbi:hypothetical protein QQ045_030486 [Rhodiola kirilowii]